MRMNQSSKMIVWAIIKNSIFCDRKGLLDKMSKRSRTEAERAATKRGGRGPKRAREGTAMTHMGGGKSYLRPGQAGVGRFVAHPHGTQIKLLDQIWTGAYAAGAYTPDTQPLQMLPLNKTGATQCLNLLTQGNGEANRFSNKISLKSIRIRLGLYPTSKSSLNFWPTRAILYYDRNPGTGAAGGGAYKPINLILADMISTNAINTATCTGSSLNPTLFDQVVILKDHYFVLPAWDPAGGAFAGNTGPTDPASFLLDWYVPLKDLETIYNQSNATPTIADINTGALCLAVISESVANSTDAWQLRGTMRLRFKDN